MDRERLCCGICHALVAALIIFASASEAALATSRRESPQNQKLIVAIVDENGVAVASARISLTRAGVPVWKCETDHAGKCEVAGLEIGGYQLNAEKEGFYEVTINDVNVVESQKLEVTLYHQQEFAETVNVSVTPKEIEPQKTAAGDGLDYLEIINLPYTTSRDIRNALPYIPGVLQDSSGQLHVGGAETRQVFDDLDGFNITHPVTGMLDLRVSADALRGIDVQSGRFPVQYGKASGGVIGLTTGMGDDRYRFSATNFVPTIQNRKGLNFRDWTPRATFSGPFRKGRAWFFEAADAEYKLNIVEALPSGADRNSNWRISNLAKSQINLSNRNILTASFLVNRFRAPNFGLSRFRPLESTLNRTDSAYLIAVKDQAYLSSGALLEVGFAVNQLSSHRVPLGDAGYVITPEGARGNFFESSRTNARRLQTIASLTLPTFQWSGRHEVKIGADIDRINYDQFFARRAISVLREDGKVARTVSFIDSPRFEKPNSEVAMYAQDRWSPSDRLLFEGGVRMDWDQVVRSVSLSPRFAATYLLTSDAKTKLAAGIGLFNDGTPLELIARPLAGKRVDSFFNNDGTIKSTPIRTSFAVTDRELKPSRVLNWSAGVERRLPASVFLRVEFLEKRGWRGFTFDNQGSSASNNVYSLQNNRRERYDSLEVTVRRTFAKGYNLFASYVRSSARSNAVLDFKLDELILNQQASGRLPWDSPNRFISRGWLPLFKGFDAGYALDWRDGFPFSLVNQYQQLVGEPNSRRLPAYFSLNVHLERRFRLFGVQWALRGGSEDVTGRKNPSGINNNVDSLNFLTPGGLQHRVFTARIRFLGRK